MSGAPRSARALDLALSALAIAFVLAFVAVAFLRLGYRYELEWIEGGSLAMVERLRAGLALYVAPSLRYVPFNYTPFYYLVTAPLAGVLGGGFLPLRLVSLLASLACAGLIFAHVRLETRDARAGALAAALFLASFRFAGAWMDLAHSDSLALALLLAGFLALRAHPHDWRGGLAGGALAALSFLTKQTAAVAIVPAALLLLFWNPRRGVAFGLSAALIIAGSTLRMDAMSDGWYRYYVFGLAGHYAPDLGRAVRFWSGEFAGTFGIAALGGLYALRAGGAPLRAGRGITYAAVAGLALSSCAVRAFPAAYDNVLLPACAAAAVLFGLGWHAASSAARAAPTASWLSTCVALAGLLQFSVLLYDPVAQVPTARDRAEGDQLLDNLRRTSGSVLVPCHDYLVTWAGKGPQFHEMALAAVTQSGTDSTATRLSGQLLAALAERRWSTILLDNGDWLWDEVARDYEPSLPVFGDPGAFRTRTGAARRPELTFVPRTSPPAPAPAP